MLLNNVIADNCEILTWPVRIGKWSLWGNKTSKIGFVLMYALKEYEPGMGCVNMQHNVGVNCFTCLNRQGCRLFNLMQFPMISFTHSLSFISLNNSMWTSRPDSLFSAVSRFLSFFLAKAHIGLIFQLMKRNETTWVSVPGAARRKHRYPLWAT
jgi:hypothetical protein